jgi:ABC-type transport system involved in multi-copper enzyme maturation permease subunit
MFALFSLVGLGILMLPLMGIFGVIGAAEIFMIEEKDNLQLFYLSLPLSRKSIVKGRFAFMFSFVFILMILSSILSYFFTTPLLLGDTFYVVSFSFVIALAGISFASGGLFCIFMYPIMFRYGYEKGKIFGFIIPTILGGGIIGGLMVYATKDLDKTIKFISYASENLQTALAIVTLIALVVGSLLYFSAYCLSQKFYARRSF